MNAVVNFFKIRPLHGGLALLFLLGYLSSEGPDALHIWLGYGFIAVLLMSLLKRLKSRRPLSGQTVMLFAALGSTALLGLLVSFGAEQLEDIHELIANITVFAVVWHLGSKLYLKRAGRMKQKLMQQLS